MKLGILALMLTVGIGVVDAQRNKRDDTGAIERACTVTDCFLERDIRNFEVIDQTHVIVYTGSQRCAFHVEVQGTFCDLTFAPELYFSRTNDHRVDTFLSRPLDPTGRNVAMDPLATAGPRRRNLEICANDLAIQVHGGRFTESMDPTSPSNPSISTPATQCRVSGVTAITDDQLLEFYVNRGVLAPPPPMGPGEIEVGEQAETGSTESASDGAAAEEE